MRKSAKKEVCRLKQIAHIETEFPTKFGLPRQSGLVDGLRAAVVFEPEYRVDEALRGIEEWSHLWLIWEFSDAKRENWSPTVRPPRLGGNTRVGVFATRSPYRPNPVGLSCVRLEKVEKTPDRGAVIWVRGADLKDGTPIYDVKPYLPYADSHPEAAGGFAEAALSHRLQVEWDETVPSPFSEERRAALLEVLSLDPRPAYQNDPDRVYGFEFAGYTVRFSVDGNVLFVKEIVKTDE